MQGRVITRILGVLCLIFSITMLPPVIVSWMFGDGEYPSFLMAFAAIGLTGLVLWTANFRVQRELRDRDGFVVVVLFWVVLGLFGAIPLYLFEQGRLSITDAVFESISGLTTTGATVITDIDGLPASVLYYRQQLQWLGGMGIIVLAVAIMPMLGVGGMQLYRAETPGSMKDTKLAPRITETAKALWYIYLGLTVVCAVGYRLAGMSTFDAIGHSFSTVAIGGFSTHDASMGYFANPAVHVVAIVFMLLAAMNFTLHFTAWHERSPRIYLGDTEVKVCFSLIAAACVGVTGALALYGEYRSPGDQLQHGIFQVVSIMTATGLDRTTDFGAVAACLNNLGPGIGEVSANYGAITDAGKWILSFAMLLGRLELMTLRAFFDGILAKLTKVGEGPTLMRHKLIYWWAVKDSNLRPAD